MKKPGNFKILMKATINYISKSEGGGALSGMSWILIGAGES